MSESVVGKKIYIGAPIEQDSEREFLASTVKWLEDRHVACVVLANAQINGRQIDCIVATSSGVSVVEVKSSYLPVRGDLNGSWERLHASGEWQPYTNAYLQALAAKNALRDAMMAVKPVGTFYPQGHVVFTSGFAEGSQVTGGDFKVAVTTLDMFLSSFHVQGTAPWPLEEWQAFAAKLALAPISVAEATASTEYQEGGEILRRYNAAFVAEYGKDAARWFPEDSEQGSGLLAAAMTGAGCFITGASGCGKTLMAKHVGVELANGGNPTFFFAAKDFTGSWADCLRREVALLGDQSPSALLRAISRVDKPVFLVLDAINELGAYRASALRGIRALARRLGAKLVITGQEGKPPEFDGLSTLMVSLPSFDLKCQIARSTGIALSATALEFLKAVGSGIEAEMVGRVGQDLKANTTRLVLLDQYIRMRLGAHARVGSFGLRRLASSLHEQVAFSLSEANFDEFMSAQDVPFGDCDALFAAGLLVRRSGRVSFSHEMIQNGCAAFDLARQAGVDPATFGLRLSTPFFEPIAGDVISAIEDTSTCRAVLGAMTSPVPLSAAADGVLGAIAGSIARTLLGETADACAAEIRGAQLVLIKKNGAVRVEWAEVGRRRWTGAERARLVAIGLRAESVVGLDVYMELCAQMDKRLVSEGQQLAEAAKEEKFPLKSQSFSLAYLGLGNEIGFTHVARASRPGIRGLFGEVQKREVSLAEMSSGQLHFFLENRHVFFGYQEEDRFAEELIYLLRERFRWEPYHVQLAILHAVGFAHKAPDKTLARLVEAINALEVNPTNWAINSSIIDALKFLGAIDEGDETRNQIRCELASVLTDEEGAVDKDLALSLCIRMFDHPFDWIYGQEICGLDENLRRRLYRRALGASDIKNSMSLAWLSRQVALFEDASDAPLLHPLAALPDPSNPFAREEWAGFVLAIRFLGRHGGTLPSVGGSTSAERCLADIRTLIYAAESQREPDIEGVRLAWQRLHAVPPQLVIGCLSEVNDALADRLFSGEAGKAYPPLNLIEVYPADCLKVARRFVEMGVEAEYFHQVPRRELGSSLACGTIGRYGDRGDIDLLRRYSRDPAVARYAVTALKSLDTVSAPGIFTAAGG
jgi:hypothetical protein